MNLFRIVSLLIPFLIFKSINIIHFLVQYYVHKLTLLCICLSAPFTNRSIAIDLCLSWQANINGVLSSYKRTQFWGNIINDYISYVVITKFIQLYNSILLPFNIIKNICITYIEELSHQTYFKIKHWRSSDVIKKQVIIHMTNNVCHQSSLL